jgi:hypothetical protein
VLAALSSFGEIVIKLDTDVLIKSESVIPIEIIESSKGISDILLVNLPFLITIIIVISAATVTYRSNRKSVESQNKLSQVALKGQADLAIKANTAEHENKISEFRHHWLQEVRGTASSLIKIIHECQYHTMARNLADDRCKEMNNETSKLQVESINSDLKESYSNLISKRAEFYEHHAKLCLLFKKDEPETKMLFKKLNTVKTSLANLHSRSLDDEVIVEITEELQVVLKSEWEATKERSWISKT